MSSKLQCAFVTSLQDKGMLGHRTVEADSGLWPVMSSILKSGDTRTTLIDQFPQMLRGLTTVHRTGGYRHVGFETKSSCRFTYEDQCATAVNTFSHLKDTSDVNKYSGADSRGHSTAQD